MHIKLQLEKTTGEPNLTLYINVTYNWVYFYIITIGLHFEKKLHVSMAYLKYSRDPSLFPFFYNNKYNNVLFQARAHIYPYNTSKENKYTHMLNIRGTCSENKIFVTPSTKIRNKSETLHLAIPLRSVRRGEFGCDGRFSGVYVFN